VIGIFENQISKNIIENKEDNLNVKDLGHKGTSLGFTLA
jgi:hypothetical protein